MPLTVNILLNGVHTESVFDTAAMVTLVREDYFNEINFTGESGPTCNLTGINNDPIKGKIIKKCIYHDRWMHFLAECVRRA